MLIINYFKLAPIVLSRSVLRNAVRKMHKAYFRFIEGSESYQLSINIKNEALGVDRQFNFSRQVNEDVGGLLNRVFTNVEKVFSKKENKKRKKNKVDEPAVEKTPVVVELHCDGQTVPNDRNCKDVIVGSEKANLVICGIPYEIIVNAPWVGALSLPESIMAGFPVYPTKLECLFADKSHCTFHWYRRNGAEDWSQVGDNYYYTPTTEDIGRTLKLTCIPGNGSIEGPSSDVVSKNPVEAGPGHCPFEVRHSFTREKLQWPTFRVMSYNILADLYADSDTARNQLYFYCPAYALGIDYRKQLICKEIMGYNADLICLQEVDKKVFVHDLEPLLSYMDYGGVFEKKGGQVSEGLACFFSNSKFRLRATYNICLAEELPENPIYNNIWEALKDNENFVERFKKRTTCVLVTVLQSVLQPDHCFIVGNTHLYFRPDADHVRLVQAGMILQFIEDLLANLKNSEPDTKFSVIMCGDFNSTPEWGVFQLMTTQMVPEDLRDWRSNMPEKVENLKLSHNIPLDSACGTPKYTNYTHGFTDCLDYIFYQKDNMSVSQVIPLPSEEELKQHVALPNVVFPSDHLALVCDLLLKE